jgi:hypothetical protein
MIASEPAKPESASVEELRAHVDANREALALARLGLGREVQVPLASKLQEQIETSGNAVGPLRRLARLMQSEARLAVAEGRRGDAVQIYFDMVRLGCAMGRGGLILDDLVGQAVTFMGLEGLIQICSELTPDGSRRLIRDLDAIDASRESAAEVLSRERAYAWAKASAFLRLQLVLNPTVFRQLSQPAEQSCEVAHKRTEALIRLLEIDLAVRAYHQEQGAAPDSLAFLIPRYLAKIPVDPFSGRLPIYRQQGDDTWRLYSVGPDGQDDGGSPIRQFRATSQGDMTLDVP